MTHRISIRANPVEVFPATGIARYSGSVSVDGKNSAEMTLDVARTGALNPSAALAAMAMPEAEGIGLGPGVIERVGLSVRAIKAGAPLSPAWLDKLLEHPSTAAILATAAALPTPYARVAPLYFAARAAEHIDDATARILLDDARLDPATRAQIAAEAARDATVALTRAGWNVVVQGRDLQRAIAARRVWKLPSSHPFVAQARMLMAVPLRSGEQAAESLGLHLAALMAKGMPCSCQATTHKPSASAAPSAIVGCACRLQPVRVAGWP